MSLHAACAQCSSFNAVDAKARNELDGSVPVEPIFVSELAVCCQGHLFFGNMINVAFEKSTNL